MKNKGRLYYLFWNVVRLLCCILFFPITVIIVFLFLLIDGIINIIRCDAVDELEWPWVHILEIIIGD